MSGTGIAGAQDYEPAGSGGGRRCCACRQALGAGEGWAARAAPGGMLEACSRACAATPAFAGRLVLIPQQQEAEDERREG